MHRDLKLDNILVTVGSQGTITNLKLADFGMACKFDKIASDTVCGTIGYMAPELLVGEGEYDEKVDIWSLGVILYNLVTGKMPYIGTQ